MNVAFTQTLQPDSPLWCWAYEAVSTRAAGMLEHMEGVRRGEDIEAVHDMRVGSRRLVAAMKVFHPSFPGFEFDQLLREARRLTRSLGAVRDLDVLIDYHEKRREEAPEEELLGLDYFLAVQRAERRKARRPMLDALLQIERTQYEERLQRYLRHQAEAYSVGLGPYAEHSRHEAVRPFREAAPPVLRARADEFFAFEPFVHDPEEAEQLHEMRIAAKWLRYTMELFAPAYADQLGDAIGAAKKFQELLGDLHDSDVRLWLLEAMVREPLSHRGLESVGLMLPDPVQASLRALHAREETTRAGCYLAFYREWQRQEKRGFRAALYQRLSAADA